MTVKEYLSQAYRIDQRINSKLEQVASLRALATKATSTLSDTPPSGSRNVQSMENVIVKIIDLENEINDPEVLRDHLLLRDKCDELDDTRFHQQELFDEWERLAQEQEELEADEA